MEVSSQLNASTALPRVTELPENSEFGRGDEDRRLCPCREIDYGSR
jgi:hypothetical protein